MDKINIKQNELISIISHEIKNSLNPVINLSGIMLKDKNSKFSGTHREYLEVIERNGRRILSLVDHFSYLSRLKNSGVSRSYIKVGLQSAIESAINTVLSSRNAGPVSVEISVEGDKTPVTDPEILRRIIACITEFFISTVNYDYLYFRVFSGNGSVSITASEAEPGGSSGTGDYNLSALNETSLLWYSMASELIFFAGGTSGVTGTERGTEWRFSLPAQSGEGAHEEITPPHENDLSREFILMVIDDDPDTVIPIKAIAEHEFNGMCRVVTAHSGSEAIDLLEKVKPDVILLDLTLPDISGFSLIRSVKNFFVKKDVPVIAFTGHDIALNREKILSAGFDDIITKPFDIDEFVEKIGMRIK